MQETPAAHETFARVLAIDDVVDRGEIGLAVAFAAFRRGILPGGGLRVLHPLRRRRMRRQEVLRARIDRGLAGLQLGVALHRGQEARGAIGVEMRARRNADADAVGLELLGARKARHRQLGLGERQRGQIGIVAHVGDDAGDDGGLARLVLADRCVFGQHMRHLVAQHRGQFRGVAGQRDQAARHIELAGRQRERIDRARIEDRHLVGLVGTIGRRDQPVDGLADQGFQLRIVIGAAIGATESAHARARRPASAPRCAFGLVGGVPLAVGDAVWNRLMSPQAASASAAHSKSRRSPKAAAHPCLAPSRTPSHVSYSSVFGELIPAQQFNLPHPERLDSRPAPRLDQAADPNPSIFERLKDDSGGLERRHHAP